MMPVILSDPEFRAACHDYDYLLAHEYPERGSLKMVGDRYRLTRDQRSVLYRGISSNHKSTDRKNRLVDLSPGMHLVIDGYNVLFTILNYRLGRMVFISTDGILRDAGSLHGKLRDDRLFQECIDDLFHTIIQVHPVGVDLYLDSPVSSSQRHHMLIGQKFTEFMLPGICHLVPSADYEIRLVNAGVLASSDTVLIERTPIPVTDLARRVLENRYGAVFLGMNEILGQ